MDTFLFKMLLTQQSARSGFCMASPFFLNPLRLKSDESSKLNCVINIQDIDDFNQRIAKNSFVLVDFHAKWCGPCKILGPRLEKAVESYCDEVLLAKVNIDNLSEIADKYEVSAVPTVVFLKKGKEVDRFIGLVEESSIMKKIENVVNS